MTSTAGSVPPSTTLPPAVSWVQQLERASVLDPVVGLVRPLVNALVADPARRDLLRGAWLGHAVHPPLTDVTLGFWTSAVALDLIGGRASRPAARRLVALGLLSVGPTLWTGWAEWSGLEHRDQRVGLVHALANGTATAGFLASWRARRRGQHARGAALALASSGALTVGGFLGGHLASARNVASHHPAFDAD